MSLTTRVTRRWATGGLTTAAIALVAASTAADPQRDSPAEGRLAFEAATVKLAAPDAVRNRVMPTSPNRLYIPGMTLRALIYNAYGDGGFNTSMRPAAPAVPPEFAGPALPPAVQEQWGTAGLMSIGRSASRDDCGVIVAAFSRAGAVAIDPRARPGCCPQEGPSPGDNTRAAGCESEGGRAAAFRQRRC